VRFRVGATIHVAEVAYKRINGVASIPVGARIGVASAQPGSSVNYLAFATIPVGDAAAGTIYRYRMNTGVTLSPGVDYWYVSDLGAEGSLWDVPNLYGLAIFDPTYFGTNYSQNFASQGWAPGFEFATVDAVVASPPPASILVRAPQGDVSGGPTVNLSAPPAAVAVRAPTGTPVVGSNATFPVATIKLAAPQGDVTALVINRSGDVLQVTLPNGNVIERQPGTLYVSVANGPADANIYYFFDFSTSFFASGKLDAAGSAAIYAPINGFTVGQHTVRANTVPSPPNSGATFTVQSAQPSDPVYTPLVPPPITTVVPVNHWVFQAYDFSSLSSVDTDTFQVNPDSVTQKFGDVQINAEATTVSNGQVITWEGSAQPPQWSWSGRVLNEEQYNALVTWGTTRQRVYLTDHFRRRFLVKVLSVEFDRVRDAQRQWHMKYQMTAAVLSGEGIVP
jgi:hypothetical protein